MTRKYLATIAIKPHLLMIDAIVLPLPTNLSDGTALEHGGFAGSKLAD
jgi:hypothetical protein